MYKSALWLQISLCLIALTLSLPHKSGYYASKEELPKDPWQESMAELRVYSMPMPPLVKNDDADLRSELSKPDRNPDYMLEVPLANVTSEPGKFTVGVNQMNKFKKSRQAHPFAVKNSLRPADMQPAGNNFGQPFHDREYYYDEQEDVDEDPNCPRDLYYEQMNMDFGETPKKYDWEQIGRHFVNYGRFTNDMSDDLMRGLDNRFKQMKG